MPFKYKKEDGTEVEVFEQSELDEQVAAAKKEGEASLTELQTKLKEAEDALEAAKTPKKEDTGNKEDNIAALKQQIEDLSKKLDDQTNTTVNNVKEDVLNQLSNGDADVRARLEKRYETFAGEPTAKQEIEARLLDSYRLEFPEIQPSTLDEAYSSIASSNSTNNNSGDGKDKTEFTPIPGVSEEDIKKYSE